MSAATEDIFADIETVPAQSERILRLIKDKIDAEVDGDIKSITAPGNYKDPEKIAAFMRDKQDEIEASRIERINKAVRSTSLDGGFGEVYCIGAAVHEAEAEVFSRGEDYQDPATEVLVLRRFFEYVSDMTEPSWRKLLIGHNFAGFDVRFLHQRCMVRGVRPPQWLPLDPKPWGEEVFDTMVKWAGARDRVSLTKLCQVFGIDDADEIDGSQVWDCILRGEFEKVDTHCAIDVEKVRTIYRRMKFMED